MTTNEFLWLGLAVIITAGITPYLIAKWRERL